MKDGTEDPGEKGPGGPARIALAASLVALLVWMVLAAWRESHDFSVGLVHGVASLVLGVGALLGGAAARRGAGAPLGAMALLLALLVLLGRPFYTNAEAAAGVQLVALSGLLLAGSPSGPRAGPMTAVRTVLAAATGALGVLLAARSQAASVLVVLMVVVVVLALRRGTAPARHAILAAGLGVIGAAMVVVVVLGGLPVWPRWLRAHGSLSGARHRLWGDALALWGEHPVLGGGPGSFLEFSATARSEPHLYAAHSSILQVGAEFGAVGALLFVGVLVTGTLTASRGEGARGVIGVAAWCALAVHSMIDHLYEFPLVCLLAGLVIGWAGSRRSHAPLRRDSA